MHLVATFAFAIGAFCGAGVRMWRRQRAETRLRAQASALREAAMVEAEGLIGSSGAVCEAQVMRLREKRAQHKATQTQQLADHDMELRQREELYELREADLQRTEADAVELGDRVIRLETLWQAAATLCRELPKERVRRLSARAECRPETVVAERVQQWVESATLQAQIEARTREGRGEEQAGVEARRLLSLAMDRYCGVGHLERIQNTFPVGKSRVLLALCAPDGPMHVAFAEATDCTLWHDPEANALGVRADDPLSRELGRRVMHALSKTREANVAGLQREATRAQEVLRKEVEAKGREAFQLLDLPEAHPEVMALVGRLQFRLSYSQNQWKHAVEVAHLCGMVAAEMGYDVQKAKRGGLLHDIGKALTHEREGSHAVIGAEVARRCGEDPDVANAIGAHHADEPPTSPLAYIVAACDAISGARPGARRDTVTQYLAHIHDLQQLTAQIPEVRRVDIMQAGREVRVVVNGAAAGAVEPGEVPQGPVLEDAALYPLAQRIARSIEEELTYAGQIRVTVIRESRAVSVAY